MTRDSYPYIAVGGGDPEDFTPATRAVIARAQDRWAKHPPTRRAQTIRDQWADFETTDARNEQDKDRNR